MICEPYPMPANDGYVEKCADDIPPGFLQIVPINIVRRFADDHKAGTLIRMHFQRSDGCHAGVLFMVDGWVFRVNEGVSEIIAGSAA